MNTTLLVLAGTCLTFGVSSVSLADTGLESGPSVTDHVAQQTATDNLPKANSRAAASLKEHLVNMDQYKAMFSQRVLDAEGEVVHEAMGTITMARPNKLRWETTFPDETLLIADGSAVWNIDSFVEQVTVISQSEAIQNNPIVLLTSEDDATWSNFTIEAISNDDATFRIRPLSNEGNIQSLTLSFSEAGLLTSLAMLDAQQQVSQLTFNEIVTVFDIDGQTFVPHIPDAFIIDDQR
ncbi:outer membrane lipoprotein chaperone LolA [Alteromonas sp. A079]|uniref:outer membrane lipoprotein chaperone LolA n=1 Tax=Alteromonas sp. A079 TaxID=3410268 RepID=UPI003B9F8F64